MPKYVNESSNSADGLFLTNIRLRTSDRLVLRNAMKKLFIRFNQMELHTVFAYLHDDMQTIVDKYAKSDIDARTQTLKYVYDMVQTLYNIYKK